MCGIVGYIGTEQAAPIILDGLSKLEYRGYDSAGMAIFDGEKINTRKAVGRLKVLENLTHGGENMKGTSGIGHTRWATHGSSQRYQFSSAYEQCGNHCRGTQRHYRELYSPEEKGCRIRGISSYPRLIPRYWHIC